MNHANSSYRPEIDGLRALSIIAVVLNHANLGAPGGYVGVEVFFVISGFLITQLILKDLEQGSFSLADFWVRRIRRILPALAVMILTVLVAGYYLLPPHDLEHLGKSTAYQSLLVSNVYFLLDQGHFAMPKTIKPLVHTWSLAVEEQFYLLFPLLLWACARLRRIYLVCILLAIALISFAISTHYVATDRSTAFFLLPSRAWELLVGSLLALLPKSFRLPRVVSEIASITGLTAIISACLWYDSRMPFPGLSAALPVGGAAAIILTSTSQSTLVGKLLSLKPFTFIGKISYSLYLWHWPIQVFFICSFVRFSWLVTIGIQGISFIVSVLSWYYIERPFRGSTRPPQRKFVFATALAVQFMFLGISLIFWKTEGYPSRLSAEQKMIVADTSERNLKYESFISAFQENRLPSLGQKSLDSHIDFALFGDRHAVSFAPLFDQIARRNHRSGIVVAKQFVPPFPQTPNLKKRNDLFLNTIREHQITHVFIACDWSLYFHDQQHCHHLANLLDELTRAGVSQVSILRQVPAQSIGDAYSRHLFVSSRFPKTVPLLHSTLKRHESFLRVEETFFNNLRSIAKTKFELIDTHTHCFDSQGRARVIESGRALYADANSLTNIGAERFLSEPIESAFRRMTAVTSHELPIPSGKAVSTEDVTLDESEITPAVKR